MAVFVPRRFPADPAEMLHRFNDEARLWCRVASLFHDMDPAIRRKVYRRLRHYIHSCDRLDVSIEARTVREIFSDASVTVAETWADQTEPVPPGCPDVREGL